MENIVFNNEENGFSFDFNGENINVVIEDKGQRKLYFYLNNEKKYLYFYRNHLGAYIDFEGRPYFVELKKKNIQKGSDSEEEELKSQMPGKILKV